MSSKRRLAAVALSALLVLSVVGPAIAVAQTDEETDGSLSVDVRNSGDDVVVVVEDENGSVDGATVTVSAVEETDDEEETDNETSDNETEDGTTDNETDDEEETDNETTNDETTENETDDGTTGDETSDNETADTETDGGYAGEGTYTTGANGTVELPAPEDGVRLQVSVDAGNRTTTSEVTVNDGVGVPLGQRVALLVQQLLQGDGNVTIGQAMSEFARGDNPGNAPTDAGPPEDRGNDSDAERGPPENRGNNSDAERGPPEDRGDDNDDDSDAERGPPEERDDDGDDGDDGDDNGNGGNGGAERGPPEDRGN